MEDVVNASSSNPAHRRNEMMACVKGLELIAEMRGDCAVFYTITCPSRFHSTLNNGRPNPTWTNATVNPCVITPNTLMPGRLCIVFSNSASLVFRGVRLTVNCDCWLVRRQGSRGTKKQVRRYWITHALMPFWLLLMLVVLPPTS